MFNGRLEAVLVRGKVFIQLSVGYVSMPGVVAGPVLRAQRPGQLAQGAGPARRGEGNGHFLTLPGSLRS